MADRKSGKAEGAGRKIPRIALEAGPSDKGKKPRTVMLDEANFIWLQQYCLSMRTKPSHLIDEWIARLRQQAGE
jgi:hypothetical protein